MPSTADKPTRKPRTVHTDKDRAQTALDVVARKLAKNVAEATMHRAALDVLANEGIELLALRDHCRAHPALKVFDTPANATDAPPEENA